MLGRSHKQNKELNKVKTKHPKHYNNEKSIVSNSTENVKVRLGNKNKYESKKPKKFHVKKTRERTMKGKLKQFSKLLNEAYNPNEPWLTPNNNGDGKLISYHFDDKDSIKEVIDSFTSFKKKDYVINKLSNYEQAQLFRMLFFAYLKIKDISEGYKALSNDDIIFFEYITNEAYKTIEDTLITLAKKLKDTREWNIEDTDKDAATKFNEKIYEYNKYDSDLQYFKDYMGLNKFTPEPDETERNKLKINIEEISELYEEYKQNKPKQNDASNAEMKEYANHIKGILSETFVPRYRNNKLIIDKEFVEKLREENGKLIDYMNKPEFRTLFTPEERVKLIRGCKQMEEGKKDYLQPDYRDEDYYEDEVNYLKRWRDVEKANKIKAITFDPNYKQKPNITYIKSGVIKNSYGDFTLHEIGEDTRRSDKLDYAPVFEAHISSNGTGDKSEAAHCFIRFRATEYDPDSSHIRKYKRKVYSLGFYPAQYGGDHNTTMKETSTFRKFTNLVKKTKTKKGLIIDDGDLHSRLAITRKCDNEKIKELDNCIHNFASKECYNSSLNNSTAFVSKISKDIGFRDISRLFGGSVIRTPNLAAKKLKHAMWSKKYMEDSSINFKDFAKEVERPVPPNRMDVDDLYDKFQNGRKRKRKRPSNKELDKLKRYSMNVVSKANNALSGSHISRAEYKSQLKDSLIAMRKLRKMSRKQGDEWIFIMSKVYIDRINKAMLYLPYFGDEEPEDSEDFEEYEDEIIEDYEDEIVE